MPSATTTTIVHEPTYPATTLSPSISISEPPSNNAQNTPRPDRPRRPNYNEIHAKPLPLTVYPLPAFIPHNPISLLRIAYIYLSQYLTFTPPSSHRPPHETYKAFYDAFTQSIHVTDPEAIKALWEQGFWGKGSLSRSEPEWKKKWDAAQRGGGKVNTAAEVTRKRREERRMEKLERARREAEFVEETLRREREGLPVEARVIEGLARIAEARVKENMENNHELEKERANNSAQGELDRRRSSEESTTQKQESVRISSTTPGTVVDNDTSFSMPNQEHLQLIPAEAFFLHYALGALSIYPSTISGTSFTAVEKPYSSTQLLNIFRRSSTFPPSPSTQPLSPDDHFILNYVVYHHFRSLGWVVRPGIKFAVDFLLYYRGPAFSHAEFAILILPSYSHPYWRDDDKAKLKAKEPKDWWWLHAANRVQSQVRKSLVLVYVEVPPPEDDVSGDVDVGRLLKRYKVREFMLRRWSANRNR